MLAPSIGSATSDNVVFTDDFEYDDSLANHGWTIENGNPHTELDPENSGNRVASLEEFGVQEISHSFIELELVPGMEISTRFYDTMQSGWNCDTTVYLKFDNDAYYLGVGWLYVVSESGTHRYPLRGGFQVRVIGIWCYGKVLLFGKPVDQVEHEMLIAEVQPEKSL